MKCSAVLILASLILMLYAPFFVVLSSYITLLLFSLAPRLSCNYMHSVEISVYFVVSLMTLKFFFCFALIYYYRGALVVFCVSLDAKRLQFKYTVSQKKLCQCYFLNNSVKHWSMLIIFGMQHHEET